MERVKKYQLAILKVLEDFAAIKSPFMPEVENRIIADMQTHQYQLIRLGWHNNNHIHYTVFHFDIIDGKVWIQENRTDVKIEDELVAAGVSPKDIISGMQHPKLRELLQAASI